LAGAPDAPQLLRITLGADTVHTVTAFRREKVDKPGQAAKD
jgi:hypothetical protein